MVRLTHLLNSKATTALTLTRSPFLRRSVPLKTIQDDQIQMNLTPMIDVVFLLILFFMVATKFTEQSHNIELELPKVASAGEAAVAKKPRAVTVFADGRLELDGEPVDRTALVTLLATARQA